MNAPPDPAARAAEAKRRRGWIDAAEVAGAADDVARRRLLADVRAVMATFANAGEEETLAAVRLAQAEGVPVVVVDKPGVRDAVKHGETGYVSGFYDENHLRAAVAKLCRDDVLWLRMRAALGR
jgi:glycosyltransferase involved in cell wall biosynthesis